MTAENSRHSYARDGANYGYPDWWSVYRDDNPIHHWPERKTAELHVKLLNSGLTDEEALIQARAGGA